MMIFLLFKRRKMSAADYFFFGVYHTMKA